MKKREGIFLIFPVHLFRDVKKIRDGNYQKIYLIEEPRFMTDFRFHKTKLVYHRATMKCYADYLKKKGFAVEYVEYKKLIKSKSFYSLLVKKFKRVESYEPSDIPLENKLRKAKVTLHPTLNFLIGRDEVADPAIFSTFYSKEKFNFMNFYKYQRRKLDILVNKSGEPVGGKWSFDRENRKPYPAKGGPKIPDLPEMARGERRYYDEAQRYVERAIEFKRNYGEIGAIYPITHEGSRKWVEDFAKRRLPHFGMYEDAIVAEEDFLFHSVLTPMMNVGLITDREVLEIIEKYEKSVPLEAYEGFIRQIIGWRNYIYMIYLSRYGLGVEAASIDFVHKMNFMGAKGKLPYQKMWEGKTGIAPVDGTIRKIVKHGYCHHIERLMILGNYMLLMGIRPLDVYQIFMEWTIDAYDWVMMANVYGMSQHADGGKIMTRPYFSSSNYLRKMSNYKDKDEEGWMEKWDAIYYAFIDKYRDYLKKGYSTSTLVTFWEKKSSVEKRKIMELSEEYKREFFKGRKL